MGDVAAITKFELISFEYEIENLGKDYNGFNDVYVPDVTSKRRGTMLKMHTNLGVTACVPGGDSHRLSLVAGFLIGRNPFQREYIHSEIKRGLRHTDRTAMNVVDVALWDFAGRCHDAPIYRLLGGWKDRLPAYASTYHGDENGGLSTPGDFADYAEHCRRMGYRAFKIHGWGDAPIEREVANVLEVGRRVGGKMDLMLDPACEYTTWADALRVGKACDEADFFWLEDPYRDGGVSAFGHKKLREKIKTPILQCEHTFGLEHHIDFIVQGGTDFVRSGCYEDGGITGVMKVAHAAEGFGLDVELHGGGLAHRHCMASIRNTNYYELGLVNPKVGRTKPPISAPEYLDELDSIDEAGTVSVPQGPGLGVDFDWDWIEHHTVDRIEFT